MRVGLAGDWHGSGNAARHVLHGFAREGIDTVFHVGDFGVGWPGLGKRYAEAVDWLCDQLGIVLYVTPGNHENWDYVDALPYENGQGWIGHRIAVLKKHTRFELDGRQFLSLGGAPSIDFDRRYQGVSWWPNEALRGGDVMRAERDAENLGPVDVMLAHDAPSGGTDEVQRIVDHPNPRMWSEAGLQYAAEGRALMTACFRAAQPKFFAHGHYHVKGEKKVDQTQFVSLAADGEPGNGAILDIPSLSWEWLNITEAPW